MNFSLEKWTLDDKSKLIKLCNEVERDYLSNRIPFPCTEEYATWWLDMVKEKDGIEGVFRAIVVDGQYIGNVSIERKSDISYKDAEIGYLLLKDKYSQGIMTKAVKEICELAFSQLDIIRITGLVYRPNIASRRVLEKNDFVLEGILRNAVYKNQNIYDMYIYGKCL